VLAARDFEEAGPSRAAEPGDLTCLDGMPWADIERAVLGQAVQRHGGNLRAAARALGLPRSTLADRLKRRGVGSTRATTMESR